MANRNKIGFSARFEGGNLARRVLVSGASGLIGTYVMASQSSTTFFTSQLRLALNSNATDYGNALIAEAKANLCDGILSLAWNSNSRADYDLIDQHSNWVTAYLELARLAIENRIHLFLVGTCLDVDVTSSNLYIRAKSELRLLLSTQIASGEVTWFRPYYVFNIIPPRPRLLQEMLNNDKIQITVHSPNTLNDYILAEDVAAGMVKAIEKDLYGIVDIGSGTLISNRVFAEKMSAYFDVKKPNFVENKEFNGGIANTNSLNSVGWSPKHTFTFLNALNKEI